MDQMELLEAPIVDVSWLDLLGAAGLVLLAVALSRRFGAGLGRSLLVGAIRTVVQLVLVGYVLVYIFALDVWWLVVAALLLMTAVAAREAVQRQDAPTPRLRRVTGGALLAGAGLTLVYVAGLVVRVDPWYNPRYLIPLFGMILSSAMNASALAAERLAGEMENRRRQVEALLSLGAAPERAAREPVRRALRAALIPITNQLAVVGIVALPGMMTGQILAGASPLTAVRYQIVVMFMLVCAVAVAAAATAVGYRGAFFAPGGRLRDPGPGAPDAPGG